MLKSESKSDYVILAAPVLVIVVGLCALVGFVQVEMGQRMKDPSTSSARLMLLEHVAAQKFRVMLEPRMLETVPFRALKVYTRNVLSSEHGGPRQAKSKRFGAH